MKKALIALMFLLSIKTQAQVGIGTPTPDASAQLDVSSTSKGFLPPRMTFAQRGTITNPSAGLIIWCTDCGSKGDLQVFNGTIWQGVSLITATEPPPPSDPVIAAWDFTGISSPPATFAATTFNANLVSTNSLSELTRGPGAASSLGGNSFRTAGFKNEGIAITNTDYFQTTLKTAPGFSLSLSSINAKFAGTNTFYASPGVTSQFAYSLDGNTFTLIGTSSTSTLLNLSVDVSGVANLQNVPSGTTVYIRYYASGQTTTGGWGFASSALGSNGLEFTGFVK